MNSLVLSAAEWSGAREEGPRLEILSHCMLRSSGAEGGGVRLGLDSLTGWSVWAPAFPMLAVGCSLRSAVSSCQCKGGSLFGLERLWREKSYPWGGIGRDNYTKEMDSRIL